MPWIEEQGPDDGCRWEMKKLDTPFALHDSALWDDFEFRHREIPQDRFVDYEPKDLAWMVPLGMAPIRKDLELESQLRVWMRHELLNGLYGQRVFEDCESVGNSISSLWIPGQE